VWKLDTCSGWPARIRERFPLQTPPLWLWYLQVFVLQLRTIVLTLRGFAAHGDLFFHLFGLAGMFGHGVRIRSP
jgi:hypothetical protein